MKKYVQIPIDCGEDTCASAPGAFCPWVGTQRFGSISYCRLFSDHTTGFGSSSFRFEPLEDKGGWLRRHLKCLKFAVGEMMAIKQAALADKGACLCDACVSRAQLLGDIATTKDTIAKHEESPEDVIHRQGVHISKLNARIAKMEESESDYKETLMRVQDSHKERVRERDEARAEVERWQAQAPHGLKCASRHCGDCGGKGYTCCPPCDCYRASLTATEGL